MAAQGKLVLSAAADLVPERQVLSRYPHVQRGRAVPKEIARVGGKTGFHGDMVHVLDAAGNLHILAMGGDALRRLVDRLETGTAIAIDRDAGDFDRKVGDERGEAGDVVTLFSLLQHAAPLNILNLGSWHSGPLQQRLHEIGRQVVGPNVTIDPFVGMSSADGRADGIDDYGMAHG